MTQVYFARSGRLIKIGYSENPHKRRGDLQVANGDEMSLILTLKGGRQEEREYHRRFRAVHERGEWFREEGPLYKFLQSHGVAYDSRSNSPRPELFGQVLKAYCKTKTEHQALIDFGIPDRAIYMEGRGAENLAECIRSMRGGPGMFYLASDLRALAPKKVEIISAMEGLEAMSMRVCDISHPEDKTHAALLQRALRIVTHSRFMTNKSFGRRVAAYGGKVKGLRQAERRDAVAAPHIISAIVNAPELTWTRKQEILGMSKSTLRRHYAVAA